MIEHDDGPNGEPIPGLPGRLPPGERILWQGAPDRRALARTAFHTRLVGGYFALLAGWGLAGVLARGVRSPGDLAGVAATVLVGFAGVALLHLLAWGAARTTIYTLTDRRLVLRFGIAVPKCVNLPLGTIAAADLAQRGDGTGELPLRLLGTPKLGWLALWPHARPWRIVRPEPMLRAVPDAAMVAALLARTCRAAVPEVATPHAAARPATPARGGGGMSAVALRGETLPRRPLALAGLMVALAIVAAGAVRVAGLPAAASPALLRAEAHVAPLASRDLRFLDRADGAVVIEDAGRGGTVAVIAPGEQTGFIRGVMRGLARERRSRGIGEAPPFALTAWRDGELSLTDTATGRSIELTAFGTTNRAAFAALLGKKAA